MACQAGPDGVVTIVPASAETSFPPSMANLPGGQRLPGDETGDPNLQPAMTMSTEGRFSGGVCHTCPITQASSIPFRDGPGIVLSTASPSDNLTSGPTSGSSSGSSNTPASAAAASGSATAVGLQPSGSCSSESSLSLTAAATTLTPVCGCTSTSTLIPSSSCSESLMAQTTPTPSTSRCSAETSSSSTAAISTMAVMSAPAMNTSCSFGGPGLTSASHSQTTSKHHTPVSDAHIPMKPSSSCSFSNSTSLSAATIEAAASSISSTSVACSTTKTYSSSACATSAFSVADAHTPSTSTVSLTTVPTSVVIKATSVAPLEAYFTTLVLPEYSPPTTPSTTTTSSTSTSKSTTTSTDTAVSVMSVPSYGDPPPAYDKVSIAAISAPTSSSQTTPTPLSTLPTSKTASTPAMYGDSGLPTLHAFTDAEISSSRSVSNSVSLTQMSSTAATGPRRRSGTSSLHQAGSTSSADTSITTATVHKDGSYPNPQPQMFVTIVEPDAAGELQTTTMTVSEKSPWVAKRSEESDSMTPMAPIPEMPEPTLHHGKTVTVNTTIFMTVTTSSARVSATNTTTVVQAGTSPENKPLGFPLVLGALLVIWWLL